MTSSFLNVLERHPWGDVAARIHASTSGDVARALARAAAGCCSLDDLPALLSPAAADFLEDMARLAREKTLRRFGRVIQLFAPLYLSNECHNICTYCGFSMNNQFPRRILTDAEILREAAILQRQGFAHILLVSGESERRVGTPYFEHAVNLLRPHFANISLEVQPLDTHEYGRLAQAGVSAVLVYQETYHRDHYPLYHLKGRKSDFAWRLETPDRLGTAGLKKVGLGALYGLEDWRVDSYFVALHLDYLERTYWRTRYSISFPRLRPHATHKSATSADPAPPNHMSDRQFAQLICAFRLFNNEVEISLSTRETPRFRDHAMNLGVTTMSAGAKTNPGGYAEAEAETAATCHAAHSLEQFDASDKRTSAEVTTMLRSQGYEPLWKDWDETYDSAAA